jgi:hypothetical protein
MSKSPLAERNYEDSRVVACDNRINLLKFKIPKVCREVEKIVN